MKPATPQSQTLAICLPAPRVQITSERGRMVERWFGLTNNPACQSTRPSPAELDALLPRAGQILLITGPSGAGKSLLLRTLLSRLEPRQYIDLNALDLAERPLIDGFNDRPIEQVLSLLNRVGLSEAWTYLRKPSELSDGQRWRLRLAMAIDRAKDGAKHARVAPDRLARKSPTLLVCDEFAALLDRVTAAVVAHALRRTIDSSAALRAILATSHDDLLIALAPDLHVCCDFGSAGLGRLTAIAARSRSAPRSRK